MRSPARFVLSVLVAALASSSALTPPVVASPVTPTFTLQWGNQGNGPGQIFGGAGVAADRSGRLYLVDAQVNRVKVFDGVGSYLFEFGSLGSGNGQFISPRGIAIDAAGNLYVTEFSGHRVQKFTSAGVYVTKWGSVGSGNGQFQNPRGIAIDAAGNVYVADTGNNRIQKFDAAGVFLGKWGSFGSGPGQFQSPHDVAVDPSGNVYVVDTLNDRVQKFTSDGAYLDEWGTNGTDPGQFLLPSSVAVDAVGNVYVGEGGSSRIQKFAADGSFITTWGSPGSAPGQFSAPASLCIDTEANVYVMDYGNSRIQKFSGAGFEESRWPFHYAFDLQGPSGGAFLSPLGIAGGPSPYVYVISNSGIVRCRTFGGATFEVFGSFGTGDGQFSVPSGIAMNAAGELYVADTQNHRVQKFSAAGTFLLKWGSFGNGNGQFNEPAAIAVDASGNVYVVDQVNRRIQKFNASGVYLMQWGSLGSGNGQFDLPTGIAVDQHGVVYVADHNNARIQKFTADGVYLDQFGFPFGATPDDVAVDGAGNVWAPGGNGGFVYRFSSAGVLLSTIHLGAGKVTSAVGVDPAGSVYIAEGASAHVLKFVTAPSIALASDVPADEGGRVTLRLRPTSADTPNSGVTVLGYDVYLWSDPSSAPIALEDARGPKLDAYLVPATGAAEYLATVSTVDDATAAALEHGAFMVRAWTGPFTYYDSELHPAMSVDNLPPPVPGPFVVKYDGAGAHLHWNLSPAADFATFRLYRGADPAFVPGPATLLATTIDTGYVDSAAPGATYKLAAVDEHGNVSAFATFGPSGIVGVPDDGPTVAFGLDPRMANPVSGRALLTSFTLPRAAAARLELVDVAGRRVATHEVGGLGAGTHRVDLSAGGRAVDPGVYFLRLVQGADVAVRRIVVL